MPRCGSGFPPLAAPTEVPVPAGSLQDIPWDDEQPDEAVLPAGPAFQSPLAVLLDSRYQGFNPLRKADLLSEAVYRTTFGSPHQSRQRNRCRRRGGRHVTRVRRFPVAEAQAVRAALAALPRDVSTDAIGSNAPTLAELYAPEMHAAALDIAAPIVLGARGTGKSFWAGVLGDDELRRAAASAYPRLSLTRLVVRFGLRTRHPPRALRGSAATSSIAASPKAPGRTMRARSSGATLLRALDGAAERSTPPLPEYLGPARDSSTLARRRAASRRPTRRCDGTARTCSSSMTRSTPWRRPGRAGGS